ncbi:MAG: PspA/IM30 family protein [Ruminococcus flavefaciens]|nr:PspA/IM30 family protein [Ruminococcus flavefaciens]MCM1230356.1 PspA/IM30 family protein [Ruminococcus flavefaciens]
MGIFQRIGDIINSNVNDLLDKAEDPEKMVKQIIIDMQKELNSATQNYGKAKSSEMLSKRQLDNAKKISQDWENKAKAALSQGNQDLAREALSRKVKADEDVASYQAMYDSISAQTQEIGNQVETLKAKLEEAKSRQAMLIARSQMADTKKSLASSQGGFNSSSALEKFNRMEEKVIRKEAEADAFHEIATGGTEPSLNDSFAEIEKNAKVEEELARLMAGMSEEN